jgi:[acyl-carrier-protein] S-malonyltransferase
MCRPRCDWHSVVPPPWVLSRRRTAGLAAIVGLNRKVLDPILRRHDTAVAIINGVDSFVIGGHQDALDASCGEATASGATRAISLEVTVPSHTKLLAEAAEAFHIALREARPRLPQVMYRLLSGIDGETIQDIETGCDKLAHQICSPVDSAACLQSCRAAGAELALELGKSVKPYG